MQMAAIYTRVSSNRQREAHTIASQTAALVEWATTLDLEVPQQWIFEDEGYSGGLSNGPDWNRYATWRPPATSRWCSSIVRTG